MFLDRQSKYSTALSIELSNMYSHVLQAEGDKNSKEKDVLAVKIQKLEADVRKLDANNKSVTNEKISKEEELRVPSLLLSSHGSHYSRCLVSLSLLLNRRSAASSSFTSLHSTPSDVQQQEAELAAAKAGNATVTRLRDAIERKLVDAEKEKLRLDEEREKLCAKIRSLETGIPSARDTNSTRTVHLLPRVEPNNVLR